MYMLSDGEQRVFNRIKKNPYIHHKILRKKYDKLNIEEITESLWDKGFIKKTNQTKIA